MKPHIVALDGRWYCGWPKALVYGMGDTPGEAYINWALHTGYVHWKRNAC